MSPAILAGSLTLAEGVFLSLLCLLLAVTGVIGVRAWKATRLSPAEREARRRFTLAAAGKISDANLTEIHGDLLLYSYDVRGVEYIASQDVSTLHDHLPQDYTCAIGPVFVKYDPRNPANSIILAEKWSGLRARD